MKEIYEKLKELNDGMSFLDSETILDKDTELDENLKELSETIRHENNEWVLYTKDGSKVLGKHDTREKALAQERAIEISKHSK